MTMVGGSIHRNQASLKSSIAPAKSFLLFKITYSQVLQIRLWTSLGTMTLPTRDVMKKQQQ